MLYGRYYDEKKKEEIGDNSWSKEHLITILKLIQKTSFVWLKFVCHKKHVINDQIFFTKYVSTVNFSVIIIIIPPRVADEHIMCLHFFFIIINSRYQYLENIIRL